MAIPWSAVSTVHWGLMLISVAPRLLLRALMAVVVLAIVGTALSGPSAAVEPTGGISER